jgi:excisionase family DNA binding protein
MKNIPSVRPEDQIMTVKEVAAYLRVHPCTIYRLLRQGMLPAFRVGADWRFRQADILAWPRAQSGAAAEQPSARSHPARAPAPTRAAR